LPCPMLGQKLKVQEYACLLALCFSVGNLNVPSCVHQCIPQWICKFSPPLSVFSLTNSVDHEPVCQATQSLVTQCTQLLHHFGNFWGRVRHSRVDESSEEPEEAEDCWGAILFLDMVHRSAKPHYFCCVTFPDFDNSIIALSSTWYTGLENVNEICIQDTPVKTYTTARSRYVNQLRTSSLAVATMHMAP
jgi:hypothetical protein